MIAAMAPSETLDLEIDDQLVRQCVDLKTDRQIRNLQIGCTGHQITVQGACGSYYLKQLVTQAVRDAFPRARLHNAIVVFHGPHAP
jgi:hypothetical protein